MDRYQDFKLKMLFQSMIACIIHGGTLNLENLDCPIIILMIMRIIGLKTFIVTMISKVNLKLLIIKLLIKMKSLKYSVKRLFLLIDRSLFHVCLV